MELRYRKENLNRQEVPDHLVKQVRSVAGQILDSNAPEINPLIMVGDLKSESEGIVSAFFWEVAKINPEALIKVVELKSLTQEVGPGAFMDSLSEDREFPFPLILLFDQVNTITSADRYQVFLKAFSRLYSEGVKMVVTCHTSRPDIIAELLLRSRRRNAELFFITSAEAEATAISTESAPPVEAILIDDPEEDTTVEISVFEPEVSEAEVDEPEAPESAAEINSICLSEIGKNLKKKILQASSGTELVEILETTLDYLEEAGDEDERLQAVRLHVKFIRNLMEQGKYEDALSQIVDLVESIERADD